MSKIAYVRVSTQEQNEARQREALAARGIDKWFIEKTSAKDTDRPEFQKMMDWVREGDTIYIHDLSRIARSTRPGSAATHSTSAPAIGARSSR